jgi:nicotinamidase/pyrazinamidase
MPSFGPTSALIVVDIQNDFADPSGSLRVADGAQVVEPANRYSARAAAAGAFVVLTQDWHPAHTPHFARDGGIWPVHCVRDTWGAQFHPGLAVSGPVVRKGSNGEDGYSGFTMRDPTTGATIPTELDSLLRSRGIRDVAICGLATDYCVRSTGLDAIALGYRTIVLRDAIRAVNLAPTDGDAALDELIAAGAIIEMGAE